MTTLGAALPFGVSATTAYRVRFRLPRVTSTKGLSHGVTLECVCVCVCVSINFNSSINFKSRDCVCGAPADPYMPIITNCHPRDAQEGPLLPVAPVSSDDHNKRQSMHYFRYLSFPPSPSPSIILCIRRAHDG